MKQGFSLVELSIVLVILGLLTGGILAGQSLIRAAEIRAVTTELQRYQSAVNTFRDKYFALPGDMTNATKFWGDDNALCPDPAITNGTPGTCNGDGNGRILNANPEMHRAWQQLALAGLIEGTYTGLAGGGGAGEVIPGTNAPRSKISVAGWSIYNADNNAGNTENIAFDYGNLFLYGGFVAGFVASAAVIKPEEAWNIDTKLDDGRPGYGKVVARFWNNACATGGTQTDASSSVYNLTNSATACSLFFAKAY